MKAIILALTLVMTSSAMACVNLGADKMACPGDTVYTTFFLGGATVKGVNPSNGQVLLKSNVTYTVSTVSPSELYLNKGCIKNNCVGDQVFTQFYLGGARILAINPTTNQVIVRSLVTATTTSVSPQELYTKNKCEGRICVGDKIYTSFYLAGAKVLGMNPQTRQLIVQSLVTATTTSVSPTEVLISRGCVRGICVGDGVYTNFYAGGAKVVAIKQSTNQVLLKSAVTYSSSIVDASEIIVTDACVDFDSERNSR